MHGRAPTCQQRPPTSSRRSRVRTRERATARFLSGGGAARAFPACARCAAVVEVGSCPMNAYSVSEAALSLGARTCLDVPAAASDEQPAFACAHTRARHCALISGGGAAHTLASCARLAALIEAVLCPMRSHCAIQKAPFLGVRPCSDVLAAASDHQSAVACAYTRMRRRALALRRRRSTRACGVLALRAAA